MGGVCNLVNNYVDINIFLPLLSLLSRAANLFFTSCIVVAIVEVRLVKRPLPH